MLLKFVYQSCGNRIGWSWYGAVAILSLLLAPDKEAAAVFLFLGYYPIIKPWIDRRKGKWLWKGLLFNSMTLTMYWLLMHLFGFAQLAVEFAEMGGWEAESDASRMLQGLGVPTDLHYDMMADTDPRLKVKVLLAQALFGNPDIVMLDEPTNNLDIEAINWLEDFLLDFPGMVIAVSHDRHFLNTVCTHTVDIDYGKIKMYVGNYDFWYEYTQMAARQQKDLNKKNEQKIKELQAFIQRFSANASKSKQATSRKKLLDNLQMENFMPSSRRYPYVSWKPDREIGNDLLTVTNLSTGEVWSDTFDSGVIMQTLLPVSGAPGYYEIEYVTESGDVYAGELLIE